MMKTREHVSMQGEYQLWIMCWMPASNSGLKVSGNCATYRFWVGTILRWAAYTWNWSFDIIFVWRKHEKMSPCTGSRVNSNYERIASCTRFYFSANVISLDLNLILGMHRTRMYCRTKGRCVGLQRKENNVTMGKDLTGFVFFVFKQCERHFCWINLILKSWRIFSTF